MAVPSDHLVQVCTPDLSSCDWVAASEFYPIPPLSVEDAMILSGAFFGLLALVWAFRALRSAA